MFYDREKEQKQIINILNEKSSHIRFIYGPINSGKTNLIMHILKKLPKEFVPFYVNFRWRDVSDDGDFLNVLFSVDRKTKLQTAGQYVNEFLKSGSELIELATGIPIPLSIFDMLFKAKDKNEDAFKYLKELFNSIVEQKKKPIFILDELQVIKEITNSKGNLILEKLFNFLVGMTKETHLCYCFVISSDSLFINQIYSNSRLEGRSEYFLVDDLDIKRAFEVYEHFGFSNKQIVWETIGGKFGDMLILKSKLVQGFELEESLENFIKAQASRLKMIDGKLFNNNEKNCEEKMSFIFNVAEKKSLKYNPRTMSKNLNFWVDKNLLFFDPVENIIKPQSQLIFKGIKEVITEREVECFMNANNS